MLVALHSVFLLARGTTEKQSKGYTEKRTVLNRSVLMFVAILKQTNKKSNNNKKTQHQRNNYRKTTTKLHVGRLKVKRMRSSWLRMSFVIFP